jgi:hypothetical protein
MSMLETDLSRLDRKTRAFLDSKHGNFIDGGP